MRRRRLEDCFNAAEPRPTCNILPYPSHTRRCNTAAQLEHQHVCAFEDMQPDNSNALSVCSRPYVLAAYPSVQVELVRRLVISPCHPSREVRRPGVIPVECTHNACPSYRGLYVSASGRQQQCQFLSRGHQTATVPWGRSDIHHPGAPLCFCLRALHPPCS